MSPLNDPGQSERERSPNFGREQFVQNGPGDSSEEEDEEEGEEDEVDDGLQSGYQQLPQEPVQDSERRGNGDGPDTVDDNEDEDVEVEAAFDLSLVPPRPDVQAMIEESRRSQEREEVQERIRIWSIGGAQQRGEQETGDIKIDESKEEAIKAAMASFQIPKSAVPAWAKEMSEEEWKDMVRKRLNLTRKKN